MSNTITISISGQDFADLEANASLSPSKLFRSAMILWRHREEFMDVFDIIDYRLSLLTLQERIAVLQKEIMLRNERIDSLQDVLAQKELAERRIRNAKQETIGIANPVIAA